MNKKEFLETEEGKSLFNEGIKNIELVLENCQVLEIPRSMIGEIVLKDFEKKFSRTAINDISLYEVCNYVIIQIKDSSQLYDVNSWSNGDKTKLLLKRLELNDITAIHNITSIHINFLWDDEEYHWEVAWDNLDDNEETNLLQETKEVYGDIWIAIGEQAKKDMPKYFPVDKEERDFLWNMWDWD